MLQVVPTSDANKLKMYMKQPKKKLAEMLIQCNKALEAYSKNLKPQYYPFNEQL